MCNWQRTQKPAEGNRGQSCTLGPELPDNTNKTNLETEEKIPTGVVCRWLLPAAVPGPLATPSKGTAQGLEPFPAAIKLWWGWTSTILTVKSAHHPLCLPVPPAFHSQWIHCLSLTCGCFTVDFLIPYSPLQTLSSCDNSHAIRTKNRCRTVSGRHANQDLYKSLRNKDFVWGSALCFFPMCMRGTLVFQSYWLLVYKCSTPRLPLSLCCGLSWALSIHNLCQCFCSASTALQ